MYEQILFSSLYYYLKQIAKVKIILQSVFLCKIVDAIFS